MIAVTNSARGTASQSASFSPEMSGKSKANKTTIQFQVVETYFSSV